MSREVFCVVSLLYLSFSASFPIPEDVPPQSSQAQFSQSPSAIVQQAPSTGGQQIAAMLEQKAMEHEMMVKAVKASSERLPEDTEEEAAQEMTPPEVPAKEPQQIISAAQPVVLPQPQPNMANPVSLQQESPATAAVESMPLPVGQPVPVPMLQPAAAEISQMPGPAVEKSDPEVLDVSGTSALAAVTPPVEEKHMVMCTTEDRPKDKFQLASGSVQPASSCSTDPSQN